MSDLHFRRPGETCDAWAQCICGDRFTAADPEGLSDTFIAHRSAHGLKNNTLSHITGNGVPELW